MVKFAIFVGKRGANSTQAAHGEGTMAAFTRRIVLAAPALALAGRSGLALAQSSYPDKPIRILVGFSPGVAPDVTSRLFGDKWNETWAKGVTVQKVIALAKAKPDYFVAGHAGIGTSQHLAGELFMSMAHVKFQQVPYRGT